MDEQTATEQVPQDIPASTSATEPIVTKSRKDAWKPVLWVSIGIAVCAAGFFGYTWLQDARAAEREQAFERAYDAFEDAAVELDRAQSALMSIKTGPSTTKALKATSRKVAAALDEADASLASAKKSAGEIEDEEARERIQDAIESAETASEQYQKAIDGLPEKAPLIRLANDVPDNAHAALGALNDTIELVNDEKWSKAESRQKYGMSQAQTGIKKLAQLDRLREKLGAPGGGVNFAREDLRLSKDALAVEAQLIKYGRSQSTNSFNAQVKKYNNLMNKGRDLMVPEFYDDPKIFLEAHFTWISQGDASLSFAKSQSDKAKEAFLASQKD